jgi:hypothetical protein
MTGWGTGLLWEVEVGMHVASRQPAALTSGSHPERHPDLWSGSLRLLFEAFEVGEIDHCAQRTRVRPAVAARVEVALGTVKATAMSEATIALDPCDGRELTARDASAADGGGRQRARPDPREAARSCQTCSLPQGHRCQVAETIAPGDPTRGFGALSLSVGCERAKTDTPAPAQDELQKRHLVRPVASGA